LRISEKILNMKKLDVSKLKSLMLHCI